MKCIPSKIIFREKKIVNWNHWNAINLITQKCEHTDFKCFKWKKLVETKTAQNDEIFEEEKKNGQKMNKENVAGFLIFKRIFFIWYVPLP